MIQHFATDFLQRCLSTAESSDTTLHSPSPTLLLREWAKLTLTGSSWRNALVGAVNVSIYFVLVLFVDLTLLLSAVYSPAIHDLLGSLRPSRNDQSHNGCN